MDEKRPASGANFLTAFAALLGAAAAAVTIVKEFGLSTTGGVLLIGIMALGLLAFLQRAGLQARMAALGRGRRGAVVAGSVGIGLAAVAVALHWPESRRPGPEAFPGTESPEPANLSMPGSPLDPNQGSFGIPASGDGSSLFTYHRRANPGTILDEPIDEAAANTWFETHAHLPIMRNYCRIDPYAGVLAMQIVPSRDRILVRTQGSANSVLGRAQRSEPALAGVDAAAASTRTASEATCSGKTCRLSLSDGSRMSIAWNRSAQDVVIRDGNDEEKSWQDCRCHYSGSFVTCAGVQEFGEAGR